MIIVIVMLITTSGPLGELRSREVFRSMDICEAVLRAETPRYHSLVELLAARLGLPVTFDASCVDLLPGVPA